MRQIITHNGRGNMILSWLSFSRRDGPTQPLLLCLLLTTKIPDVRKFLLSPLSPQDLSPILRLNLALGFLLFLVLEIWRPCFFLTDDNLSTGFPILTEMGLHLGRGQSPYHTAYLFGGHYDLSSDISCFFWHPFYLLASLLANTPAHFWILDAVALGFLLLTVAGFTLLSLRLVEEFNPQLPAVYVVFFTLSFVFSSYTLIVTSSWMGFLANESALPWLLLGILERRALHGTLLILFFSFHEIMGAFPPMNISTGLYFSLFAIALALIRRSIIPLLTWSLGSLLAVLLSLPFLFHALGGFAVSDRAVGVSVAGSSLYSMPALVYPFSFFIGTWTDAFAALGADGWLHAGEFPSLSVLMACGAAWCVIPAVASRMRWRQFDVVLLVLMALIIVMTIRPTVLGEIIHRTPLLKSTRWPFRECLQLLFFFHVFLLVRFPGKLRGWVPAVAVFSLIVFVAPQPFSRVPALNPLSADRAAIFSGKADEFWSRVKTQLGPGDHIATVIDQGALNSELMKKDGDRLLAFSMLGTANFPAYLRLPCASGYSPTITRAELFLHTRPDWTFGAFGSEQMAALLAEKPDLKIIEVSSIDPLKDEPRIPRSTDRHFSVILPRSEEQRSLLFTSKDSQGEVSTPLALRPARTYSVA